MQNILISDGKPDNGTEQVKILPGQNLLDIAIETAQSLKTLFELADEKNMSITDDLTAGDMITCSKTIYRDVDVLVNNNQAKPASYDIRVWPRQTLFDMAIETDLSLDGLFGFANQKNMSITDALIVGDTIACGKDVYKVFIKKLPASADTQSDEQTALHGIGYDIIEDDFKVW